jgi:hypothetical protein
MENTNNVGMNMKKSKEMNITENLKSKIGLIDRNINLNKNTLTTECKSNVNQNRIFNDFLQNEIINKQNNLNNDDTTFRENKQNLFLNGNDKIFSEILDNLIKKNEGFIKNEVISIDDSLQDCNIEKLIEKSMKTQSNINFLAMIKNMNIFKDERTFNKYPFLKPLIYTKINEILSNKLDNNEKYLLYNIISNSPNNDNMINISKSGFEQKNSVTGTNNDDINLNELIDKNSKRIIVKNTIDDFCVYLKKNGFSIINKTDSDIPKPVSKSKLINEELLSINNSLINEDLQKSKKDFIKCPHKDKKHYAKNMCSSCYHKEGRIKKAWLCPHVNKAHYAKGKCQNCYLNGYHKIVNSKSKFGDKSVE